MNPPFNPGKYIAIVTKIKKNKLKTGNHFFIVIEQKPSKNQKEYKKSDPKTAFIIY